MADDRTQPVDGSLFEALFHLQAPTGALAERLLALGIDPRRGGARYSADQWRRALELYRDQLFPLDYSTGYRRLGRALAQGYGATLSGKMFLLALPMLSPAQLLRRWPRFVRMGRTDVDIDVSEDGPRSITITSRDPVNVPMDVNHGLLEFVFEKMRVQVSVEARTEPDGAEVVTYRW